MKVTKLFISRRFRELFDRTRSFRFNCKKSYQKRKILFCTKSMRVMKKVREENCSLQRDLQIIF